MERRGSEGNRSLRLFVSDHQRHCSFNGRLRWKCKLGISPQPPQAPSRICKGGHLLQSRPLSDFPKDDFPCVCVVALASIGNGRLLQRMLLLLLFVCCLTSQQHASVSQGRTCSDNFTCCHTDIQIADQTYHLTQSQYTDTGPTSPSTDPTWSGAWQDSHWSANY